MSGEEQVVRPFSKLLSEEVQDKKEVEVEVD